MKCPKCKSKNNYVKDTIKKDNYIRRRRVCKECKCRYTTYEIYDTDYHSLESYIAMYG